MNILHAAVLQEHGAAVLEVGLKAVATGVQCLITGKEDEETFIDTVDDLRCELISGSVFCEPEEILQRMPTLKLPEFCFRDEPIDLGEHSLFWPCLNELAAFALDDKNDGPKNVETLTRFRSAIVAWLNDRAYKREPESSAPAP